MWSGGLRLEAGRCSRTGGEDKKRELWIERVRNCVGQRWLSPALEANAQLAASGVCVY